MVDKEKCCGTCSHSKWSQLWQEFYCGNEDSDYYCCATAYDDTCDEWSNEE